MTRRQILSGIGFIVAIVAGLALAAIWTNEHNSLSDCLGLTAFAIAVSGVVMGLAVAAVYDLVTPYVPDPKDRNQ